MQLNNFLYQTAKRLLDFIASGLVLLIISPILIVTAVILLFTGEGEVFFRQERTGLNKKPFMLLKFVTMQRGSEKVSSVTSPNDPRVLPFGIFLRKAKINELPQLINIFLGDMSIVGFRPLVDESFEYYDQKTRDCLAKMKPGLTGIGSIVFRDEEGLIAGSSKEKMDFYREDITPLKGALEVWYFANRSFWVDLKIIFATAYAVLNSSSKFYLNWFPIREIIAASSLNKQILQ